ncbi:prolyl oligopeptidase [Xylaria sp. FL1042]|nr:prolyl oligopeptidase [Xylaria sp. FL1042]
MIVDKFTPEILISAPRRGPAIPNDDGTLALYTESVHQIGGKTRKEFYVLEIATGVSRRILRDDQAYEPTWLGDGTNTIIYLKSGSMGVTFFLTVDVDSSPLEPSVAGHVRAPVRCLKTKALSDGTLAFTVLGCVDDNGKILNTDSRKVHGGRVYCSSRLQYGDLQNEARVYTVWYSILSKQDGAWRISANLHNALETTDLRLLPEDRGFYEDIKSQYDLCKNGIIIAADTSEYRDPAWSDVSNVYFIRVHSFESGTVEPPLKIKLQGEGYKGICTLPQFSPDGSLIAFMRSQGLNRETSQIYVYHTSESQSAVSVFSMVTGRPWALAPTGFRFSLDGHSLYITAEECGQLGLYHLDLLPHAYPQSLLRNGTVSAYYPLGRSDSGRALVTSSTFVESCVYQVISHDVSVEPIMLLSASDNGSKLGLSPNQVSEIYFEGGGNYIVHAWVVKPRYFDESKKYPLAMLVHDGASTTAWLNAWNTKWNAAAWAEQGYVVVLPNITGSTGYGQDFATAIHDDWSDRPYNDLVNCLYTLRNVPGVDVDNAIIAGAGYGGYLINWIQGHPLARRFKAMICHAGIFNTQPIGLLSNPLECSEYIGELPLLGANPMTLHRCNPAHATLLRNWKTPMLVIHNERDPAYPVSEGLAAYNNLQSFGVPAKYLTFIDEGHDVLKEENSLEWHRQVFAWINGFARNTLGAGETHSISADVLRSYGKENLQKLRDVAALYDPEGVFQDLQSNGFLHRKI